jgi:hypothetical protein
LSVTPAIAATKAPEVGYLSPSHVSTTSATIEVPINPNGGETSYEIWLECQSPTESKQSCEPLTVNPQRRQGILPAGFEPKIVTDEVAGLQPGYLYEYGVIATNSAGREGDVGDGFLTCPSQGPCSEPYLRGEALWEIEGAKRAAEEAPRLEAERQAGRREAEERLAKEAAERSAKEHEVHPACVVPRLKGDSLRVAGHALRSAHCGLGVVIVPRVPRGQLVVVRQSAPTGKKLAAGSRVGLTLGRGASSVQSLMSA